MCARKISLSKHPDRPERKYQFSLKTETYCSLSDIFCENFIIPPLVKT